MTRLLSWLQEHIFRRDVFISHSYSEEDKEFTDWLRDEFIRMGYAPNGFPPASPWRKQFEKDIERSPAAIVVETPAAQTSETIGAEIFHILTHLGTDGTRCLVPILRDGDSVRSVLKPLTWVDFKGVDIKSDEHRNLREKKLRRIDERLRAVSLLGALVARSLTLRTILLVCVSMILGVTSIQSIAVRTSIYEAQDSVADVQKYVLQVEDQLLALPPPAYERVALSRTWVYVIPGTNSPLATDTWGEDGRLLSREFFRDGRRVAVDSYRFVDRTPVEKVRTYFLPGAEGAFVDRFSSDGSLTQRLQFAPEAPGGNPTAASAFRSPLPSLWLPFYR